MKRGLLIIAVAALSFCSLSGQSFYRHPEIFYYPSPGPEKYYADKLENDISDNPGLQYRMHTGMMFSSFSSFNTITSWISPKVMIPVGARSLFEVGTMISNTAFAGEDGTSGRVTNLLAYARGIYSVNEQMTVWGEVMKSLPSAPNRYNNGFHSVTMGFEYSVSPSFRIGASVTSSSGMDPFYPVSPYPGNYMYGPAWY